MHFESNFFAFHYCCTSVDFQLRYNSKSVTCVFFLVCFKEVKRCSVDVLVGSGQCTFNEYFMMLFNSRMTKSIFPFLLIERGTLMAEQMVLYCCEESVYLERIRLGISRSTHTVRAPLKRWGWYCLSTPWVGESDCRGSVAMMLCLVADWTYWLLCLNWDPDWCLFFSFTVCCSEDKSGMGHLITYIW